MTFFILRKFSLDDLEHAYELIKKIEPKQPIEFILKAVVHAQYGQEQNSVNYYLMKRN